MHLLAIVGLLVGPLPTQVGALGGDVRMEVGRALQRVKDGLSNDDPVVLARALDLEGLLDRVVEHLPEERSSQPVRRIYRARLIDHLLQEPVPPIWSRMDVLRLEPAEHGDALRADVRLRIEDGSISYFRFWLTRHRGELSVLDLEDLDLNLVKSAAVAWFLAAAEDRVQQVRLYRARSLLDPAAPWGRDFELGTMSLERLDPDRLPGGLRALCWYTRGQYHAALGEREEALAAYDRALAAGELPLAHFQRGRELGLLGRYDEALEAIERYESVVAADCLTELERGDALAGLGRREEAADAYRRCLDEFPDVEDALAGLGRCLPASGGEELRRRFEELSHPAASFEPLAIDLLAAGALSHVQVLAEALRELRPGDGNGYYYQAEVELRSGRAEAACRVLEELFARRRPPEREAAAYASLHARAALAAGDPLRAYREAFDARLAFETTGSLLADEEEGPALHELAELHAQREPGDPWLPCYAGLGEKLRGRYEESLPALFRGAQSPDARVRARSQDEWVLTLYELGLAERAYAEAPDREAAYLELLDLALTDLRADLVERLLALRREELPDDPQHAWVEACLAFLRFDYEGALAARELPLPESLLRPHAEEALVLSALRSGRSEEALRLAHRSTERDGDPYWEGVVHAVGGDYEEAIAALRRCLELGYDPADFLETPDLARALRADGFAAFRRESLGAGPVPRTEERPGAGKR